MLKKIKKSIGKIILETYKRNKQKSFDGSLTHCLATARSTLKKSKYCFLITNSDRAWPSARMVQPVIDFETLDIWFGTNPGLRKINEISKNANVTIAFGSTRENANLILYGKAEIVHTIPERKKHWLGSWSLFFPDGPTGTDFVSLKVVPEEIEIMNFKKNIVAEPFGLAPVKLRNKDGQWEI